jgi:ribosomal 50S subunit-associated protein YjgA (DUF615 family)
MEELRKTGHQLAQLPILASLRSEIETAINTSEMTDVARRMLTISKLVRNDWHDKLETFHTIREICAFVQS